MSQRGSLAIAPASFLRILRSYPNATLAPVVDQAITAIADRLLSNQINQGVHSRSWPGEVGLMEAFVPGILDAHERMDHSGPDASTELAGSYILWLSQCVLHNTKALSLTRLTAMATDSEARAERKALFGGVCHRACKDLRRACVRGKEQRSKADNRTFT